MARIVEILIALNALGGIATFLGIRLATRKTRAAGRSALNKFGIGEEDHDNRAAGDDGDHTPPRLASGDAPR